MAYNIIFTERADAEIDEIKSRLNRKAGQSFVADIYEYAFTVSMFPKIGMASQRKPGYREYILSAHLTMYYKLGNDTIFIASIFDTRQGLDKLDI
jgi:plasmid stabilization system protein ParE